MIVAVNKCDLLPRHASMERLGEWVRSGLRQAGLSSSVIEDVVCVSARTGFGAEQLLRSIKQHRRGRDVYAVGAANSGKSTLVNRILHSVWVAPHASTPPGKRAFRGKGVVIDTADLPAGFKPGDVYTGPMEALGRHDLAAQSRGAAGAESLDAGAPAARFLVADASGRPTAGAAHPLARDFPRATAASLAGEGASAPSALRDEALQSASTVVGLAQSGGASLSRGLTRRGGSAAAKVVGASANDLPGDLLAGSAALAEGSVPLPPQLRPAAPAGSAFPGGEGGGSLVSAAASLEADGEAPRQLSSWLAGVPLTASPVPGTTLGVIGAPLGPDSSGGMIYDTPGLLSDAGLLWSGVVSGVIDSAKQSHAAAAWIASIAESASNVAAACHSSDDAEGKRAAGGASVTDRPVMPLWASLPDGISPPLLRDASPLAQSPGHRALAARSPLKAARALMPVKQLRPRHVRLVPGKCLLLGGLARLDYEQLGGQGVHMLATAFTALPMEVVWADRAEEHFARHAWAGGALWPSLASSEHSWAELTAAGFVGVGQHVAEQGQRDTTSSDPLPAGSGLGGRLGRDTATVADGATMRRNSTHRQRRRSARPAFVSAPASPSAVGFDLVDWAEGVDAEWEAAPRGGNPAKTRYRRQNRVRRSLVDVVLGGMGWLAITPIEIEGMYGWERAVKGAKLAVRAVPGVAVSLRQPMLAFEASGTTPRDWV